MRMRKVSVNPESVKGAIAEKGSFRKETPSATMGIRAEASRGRRAVRPRPTVARDEQVSLG